MPRTYEFHPTRANPGDADYILVEIRNGRSRAVSQDHHAYKTYLASGREAIRRDYKAPDLPLKLDRNRARAQAVAEHLPEYHQILARWSAFGETTKGEALEPWKAKVEARALELEG